MENGKESLLSETPRKTSCLQLSCQDPKMLPCCLNCFHILVIALEGKFEDVPFKLTTDGS